MNPDLTTEFARWAEGEMERRHWNERRRYTALDVLEFAAAAWNAQRPVGEVCYAGILDNRRLQFVAVYGDLLADKTKLYALPSKPDNRPATAISSEGSTAA